MISNLITSLLVACAVGGTTASAFDDKPKEAIRIDQEQMTDSQNDVHTLMNVYFDDNNASQTVINAAVWEYTTVNQSLNNSVVNIQYSKYIQKATTQTGAYIGSVIIVFQIDVYRGYTIDAEGLNSYCNFEIDFDTTKSGTWYINTNWGILDIDNNNTYNDLIYRVIRTDADYTALNNAVTNFMTEASGTSNQTSESFADAMSISKNYLYPSNQNINNYDHQMVIIKYGINNVQGIGTNYTLNSNGSMIALNIKYDNSAPVGQPVDIPGMMYTILTMPFSFVTQAFNLTLFPGTQYVINVKDIILLILSILIVLLLVRIITKFMR